MGEYTRRLDAAGHVGYLETDKPVNVSFYERHGFIVTGEAMVLDNPTGSCAASPDTGSG